MTYILITRSPGQGFKEYQAIEDELGPEQPAGNIVSRGRDRRWSPDHRRRLGIERRSRPIRRRAAVPAFSRLGLAPGPDFSAWAFEGAQVEAPAAAAPLTRAGEVAKPT